MQKYYNTIEPTLRQTPYHIELRSDILIQNSSIG